MKTNNTFIQAASDFLISLNNFNLKTNTNIPILNQLTHELNTDIYTFIDEKYNHSINKHIIICIQLPNYDYVYYIHKIMVLLEKNKDKLWQYFFEEQNKHKFQEVFKYSFNSNSDSNSDINYEIDIYFMISKNNSSHYEFINTIFEYIPAYYTNYNIWSQLTFYADDDLLNDEIFFEY